MGPVNSIMGQIVLLAMTAPEGVSPMAVRETADFVVRPRLLAIPGVAQVIPMGGEVRQFRVSPNLAALRMLGITLDQLDKALAQFGVNTGGGFSDQHASEYLIRNLARTLRLEDLSDLVVATPNGKPVRLKQVAEVSLAAKPKRGDAGYMGKPAVIVSIEKQPDIDTIKLTKDIEIALKELGPSLPDGIRADEILFRQANFIETSVKNVEHVLMEAVVVVAVVLFAFMLNWRTTAISLTAIPLSILVAAIAFHWLGLSINTMTLGGLAIAIGELVDDAVVDVENIFRRLGENRQAGSPRSVVDVIVAASQEVRSGIVYATAIIVLVFVPLFALSGIEGRLFAPLGQAYIISILASLMVSITVTPVLSFYLLPGLKRLEEHEGWLVRQLKAAYAKGLDHGLNHAPILVALAALGAIGAGFAAFNLPRAFLPPFNEGTLTINATFAPGISRAESNRVGLVAEQLLLHVPEVKSVGRRTGRAELDEHAEGVHSSEIEVDLEPSKRNKAQVLADIREKLGVLPVAINIGQPISTPRPYAVGCSRPDRVEYLRRRSRRAHPHGEDLRQKLAPIPRLVDFQVERQVACRNSKSRRLPGRRFSSCSPPPSSISCSACRTASFCRGLSTGCAVSISSSGSTTGCARPRRSATCWSRRPTAGFRRARSPLRETDGPNQIQRENGKRRIVVFANAAPGADMGHIIADIRDRLAEANCREAFSPALRVHSRRRRRRAAPLVYVPGCARPRLHAVIGAIARRPSPRSSWAAFRSP